MDSTIGRKLLHHIKEAGLEPVLFKGNCPAFYDGPGKPMALVTLKLISPGLLVAGLADHDTLDALTADLEAYTVDPHTVMSLSQGLQLAATAPRCMDISGARHSGVQS